MEKPKISVLGIGYVGLCTAVGFASQKYAVIASTHDAEKAEKINKGIPPFHEPNLPKLLEEATQNGYLKCLANQTEKAVLVSGAIGAAICFVAGGFLMNLSTWLGTFTLVSGVGMLLVIGIFAGYHLYQRKKFTDNVATIAAGPGPQPTTDQVSEPAQEQIFCWKCGKTNPVTQIFCVKCGEQLVKPSK